MSLRPEPIGPVPEETARIAHAVFRRGNVYLKLRDELGTLYEDKAFASLFPTRGQPAEAPLAWYDRYGQRVENYALPKTEAARRDLAASIGADGQTLLGAIDTSDQTWLAQVPAVQFLRQVWAEHYIGDAGELRWREVKE